MDNILELINKNKEWLFSGIGIVLIVGLFSFFRKLINLQKKKSVPYSEPQKVMKKTGTPSTPTIIEPKSALYYPPANIILLESLSPSKILRTIREAPLLQQDEVTKHYIGLKVTWEGELNNAYTIKNDIVRIVLCSSHKGIIFHVNKNDYPGLGLLKEGAMLTVEGIIEGIEGYFVLKDARIISRTPLDANSLPK
jgi:hypothetical protein